MAEVLYLLFCVTLPGILIIALIIWLIRQPARPRTVNPYVARPGAMPPSAEALVAFDALVARWVAEERLSPAVGATIHNLIAADYAAAGFGALPTPDAASIGDSAPARPVPADPAPVTPAPTPAIPSPPTFPAAASSDRRGRSSWSASLLALGTRRALLYLGAFLLVISSLTLVIFNWASFSPLVQFTMLAGATLAIWGSGTWMTRQPALRTAGSNLQAVAALLVPIVGFALSRPGLLDLEPYPAWRLTSLLSLGLYLLVAWRTRRAFYTVAALVAALSLIFSAPGALPLGWKSALAVSLLAALAPLAKRLQSSGIVEPAAGITVVSFVAIPLLVLSHGTIYLVETNHGSALSLTLLASALFCTLRYWVDGRGWWFWLAVIPPPLALAAALGPDAPPSTYALGLGLLALGYLWLSAVAETRLLPAAAPLGSGALVIGALTLRLAVDSLETARFALAPLAVLSFSGVALVERDRLVWLRQQRYNLASGALFFGGAAFAAWIGALLAATSLHAGQIGLAVMLLAIPAFAGAQRWPGQLRPGYDSVLQTLGGLIALSAGALTLRETDTRLAGAVLLASIFGGQALSRQGRLWAALSLGAGLLFAGAAIEQWVAPADQPGAAMITALALSALYTLGGERLRTTALRYWTWPAIGWGVLAGVSAAILSVDQLFANRESVTLTLLGLAQLVALHTALWRKPELGYAAAPLLAGSALVAASEGFFIGWQPQPGDLALVICALALSLALIGQTIRRMDRAYALPYEWTAFGLSLLAPFATANDPARLTFTWAGMTILYILALWRYRLAWMLGLIFVTSDLAALHGLFWRFPAYAAERAGFVLATLVWAQALASAALRRFGAWPSAGKWGYLSAAFGGAGALVLAFSNTSTMAWTTLALAGLMVIIAQVEHHEGVAWSSLALGVSGAWLAHTAAGQASAWAAAWLILELVGLTLTGWGVQMLGIALWRRVTGVGAFSAAGLLTLTAGLAGGLAPLTFALASLGLLLTTLAARERVLNYAYGAGAAFVGAILSQMAGWGLRELQGYVIPAGVYLLILAAALRRFQGKRRVSQLIEASALALMLGATTIQALRPDDGLNYSLLLFAESLIIAAYGALARLRAPFIGGIAFFVAGVLWMTFDAVRLANQWVLLGVTGLLMVLAYVILERHQERLIRAGRYWADQLRAWE